jgi:hypothetical protein
VAALLAQSPNDFLGQRQHAAGAASPVVQRVGAGAQPVGDGQKHQVRHQLDRIAGRPVFAGLLVVVLVELADQFLENRAHGVVVHGREVHRPIAVEHRPGAEIDVRIEKLLDQRPQGIGFGKRGNLVVEFEVFEDVLDIGREAVEIVLEVLSKLLMAAPRPEIAQGEPGGVVEGFPGRLAERDALFGRRRHP